MGNDVSRAFFCALVKPQHQIYVELSDEFGEDGSQMCGRLRMSMYGTKAAAQNWQREVQRVMGVLGFIQGKSSGVVFQHSS